MLVLLVLTTPPLSANLSQIVSLVPLASTVRMQEKLHLQVHAQVVTTVLQLLAQSRILSQQSVLSTTTVMVQQLLSLVLQIVNISRIQARVLV